MMENKIIWQDRKHFMWFPISFTKYEIKNDRLYQETGLFSTHYDELLLWLQIFLASWRYGVLQMVFIIPQAVSFREVVIRKLRWQLMQRGCGYFDLQRFMYASIGFIWEFEVSGIALLSAMHCHL